MSYFNVYKNLRRWLSNVTIQAALDCGTKGFLLTALAEEPRGVACGAGQQEHPHGASSYQGHVEIVLVPICQERKQGLKWLTLVFPAMLPLR